jgi:hypothetical protein
MARADIKPNTKRSTKLRMQKFEHPGYRVEGVLVLGVLQQHRVAS